MKKKMHTNVTPVSVSPSLYSYLHVGGKNAQIKTNKTLYFHPYVSVKLLNFLLDLTTDGEESESGSSFSSSWAGRRHVESLSLLALGGSRHFHS